MAFGPRMLGRFWEPFKLNWSLDGALMGPWTHMDTKMKAQIHKVANLGAIWSQLGPFWVQLGLQCQGPKETLGGPFEPKMLPTCIQHARAEGHEMLALLIRNPLYRFRCPNALGSVLTPYFSSIFHPSWSQVGSKTAQVGPKLAPSWHQEGPKSR